MLGSFFGSKKLYFSAEVNIVSLYIFFSPFSMFEIAFAAGSVIDASQAYDINDIIRVGIALVVLTSGFLAVIFILW